MWLHSLCKGIRSVADVLENKTLSIGEYKREQGEEAAQSFLMLELLKLNIRLNLNHPLTEYDVEFIAEDIVSRYPCFTIADIALMMDNIVRGKYGQFYERINASKVLSIVEQYFEERCATAERRSQDKANKERSRYADNSHMSNAEFYKALEIGNKADEELRKAKEEARREEEKERLRVSKMMIGNKPE